MLESIQLKNYRCFNDHNIIFKPETIIVGKNNAGKSSVIEGFRLISIVIERSKNINFKPVPDWLDIPIAHRGIQPDLSGLNISWQNLFYQYKEPPATITASFHEGIRITVYLGPNDSVHAVIQDRYGNACSTKGQGRRLGLPELRVLPQVAPLSKEENILVPDYVRSNMSSYLSPLHFRNQLNLYYDEYFETFKSLVESTWPTIQILELKGRGRLPGTPLNLLVRDQDFVAEVAWMGHGLQMWLQTMWFLSRSNRIDTLILDEPDVYMHPDLQRRLLRFIRGNYNQVIIATHSTEILAEVDPHDVLILDRLLPRSSYSVDLPAVQNVIENIGSAQNLHLTRLWHSKRFILVEGKDIKYLKKFQNLLFPHTQFPIDSIPNMPIGGWSGWNYAVGSAMLLTNALGQEIITYCILDSDYHPTEIKDKRMLEARERNVELHIWNRKEIENYLIIPSVIHRIIKNKISEDAKEFSINSVIEKIEEIVESLKLQTQDSISLEIFNLDKAHGIQSANSKSREIISRSWNTLDQRVSIVSGKEIISRLSSWSQQSYRVSFGASTIISELKESELHEEVIYVIEIIERMSRFSDH